MTNDREQEEAVAQAVAAEREACAQLAAQTVCDMHIPTGVKIYGARAAKAIRARGTDAAKPVAQALDSVRVFWQQHTQADALSMTMAELHADAERAIRAALAAPAQAEPEDLSVAYFMGLHAAKRAPQPPAQAQPVATIYVTEDGSREVDDWKVELPVGATTLYTAAQAQEDAKDAARYRFLRNGEWRDTALEMLIVLQRNSLWDSKIDAAIAAQPAATPA